jgi:hypothetical protein
MWRRVRIQRIASCARHCEERSDEAIHSSFTRRDGLLRFARNDAKHTFATSRREASKALHEISRPIPIGSITDALEYWFTRFRG